MPEFPDDVWYLILKFLQVDNVFRRYKRTKQELIQDLINALEHEREYSFILQRQITSLTTINRALQRRINVQTNRAEVLQRRVSELENLIEQRGGVLLERVNRTLSFISDSMDDTVIVSDSNTERDTLTDDDDDEDMLHDQERDRRLFDV